MPELPDLAVYLHALESRVVGRRLLRVSVGSPFVIRTVRPSIQSLEGALVAGLRRIGKRIVVGFEADLFLVVHLMIAGRLQWKPPGPLPRSRAVLAAFGFPDGVLLLTEAGSKKRASLHVIEGESDLAQFDRGGLEVLTSTLDAFGAALARENHTLKRALTDPRLFSGIGNAYSDEILHRAGMSPMALTARLDPAGVERLWHAARDTLSTWIARLRQETGEGFPAKVTAFRPDMAVHGRFGKPCPVCAGPVQRIVYADNECNYCPECQTGGRLLADRSLSRLLKQDWPRDLDDWDAHFEARRRPAPPDTAT